MYNSSIMYNFYQKEDIVTFFGNMLSKCFSDHTVHLLYYISLSFQKDHRIDILFEIYTQVILKHLDKIRCRLCSENTLVFFEFYIFGTPAHEKIHFPLKKKKKRKTVYQGYAPTKEPLSPLRISITCARPERWDNEFPARSLIRLFQIISTKRFLELILANKRGRDTNFGELENIIPTHQATEPRGCGWIQAFL